jgi:hypothetical protein
MTRKDRERCRMSPSHVGALCLILRQLEVAYRMIDVAAKDQKEAIADAVDSQPHFSHSLLPSCIVVVVASSFYVVAHLHFSTTHYTNRMFPVKVCFPSLFLFLCVHCASSLICLQSLHHARYQYRHRRGLKTLPGCPQD